jgi:pseudouridine-5'-phosphate glycosidase
LEKRWNSWFVKVLKLFVILLKFQLQETQSVNVLVLDRQPNFPGFFSPRTQFRAPHCTESLEEVAKIIGQFPLNSGIFK